MLQSKLFLPLQKEVSQEETSINSQLLIRAGFIDKEMSGVYNYLPLGLRTLRKIENIIREEMNSLGGQEILMPVLSSIEKWKTTGRDKLDVDILYRMENTILNPTHEEIVTPLIGKNIFSYKDLPVAVYQIQDKFRNEPRAKSGLLRCKEFIMKDLYSFHTDEDDLNNFYEKAIKSYQTVFNRLGLGDITYKTYALGGSFSPYSHEFQTVSNTGEDTIYLCEKCGVAINKEIIKNQKCCPECQNEDLKELKAIEVGNIFKLGTKFSDAFNIKFADESGAKNPVIMGCYGMGPSRILGTIAEVFNDDKGIIWPENVAPFRFHVLSLLGKDEEKNSQIQKIANEIYESLLKENQEVLYDDRLDVSPGAKLVGSDLIGLPYRIIISEKSLDLNMIEIKQRSESKPEFIEYVDISSLKKYFK